jgi:cysteine desulfurase
MAALIYLDNHATTRLDPRVLEAMLPWLTDHYGNAGSTTHEPGRAARDAVEAARATFAATIGATPREIVFTSGATESTNIALLGLAARARHLADAGPAAAAGGPLRRHLIVSVADHHATLDPAEHLEREGFEITRLPVVPQEEAGNLAGRIRPADLRAAIRPDTLLVSVLVANNETGVVQDVAALAEIAHDAGAVVHVDCAQAIGRMTVSMDALQADLASFSAHKFHGPKGSGALFVRRRGRAVRVEPLVFGGGQERGLRSGTLDVPGIVGLAEAARLAAEGLAAETPRMRRLRDLLWERLAAGIPGLELNGPPLEGDDPAGQPVRLVNNLNAHVPGVDGQTLLATLSAAGLAVSSGSACSAENPRPSHVLLALGRDPDQARASVRFGLSRFTTDDEIERAAELCVAGAARLRAI